LLSWRLGFPTNGAIWRKENVATRANQYSEVMYRLLDYSDLLSLISYDYELTFLKFTTTFEKTKLRRLKLSACDFSWRLFENWRIWREMDGAFSATKCLIGLLRLERYRGGAKNAGVENAGVEKSGAMTDGEPSV